MKIKSIESPINSADSITLVPGASITKGMANKLGYGTAWSFGEGSQRVALYVNYAAGLVVTFGGESVYSVGQTSTSDPMFGSFLYLRDDGNLCLGVTHRFANDQSYTTEHWCANTQRLGGTSFGLLPTGSYGRAWGIVIVNDAGKMVWGRFGPAIVSNSPYMLIPGSYLDNQNTALNSLKANEFITNGQHYLFMTAQGRIALFTDNPRTAPTGSYVWAGDAPDIQQSPYMFYYGDDGNGCTTMASDSTKSYWCLITSQSGTRYLRMPLLDAGTWGFVLQRPDLSLQWGQFNRQTGGINHVNEPNEWINPLTSSTMNFRFYANGSMDATELLTQTTFVVIPESPTFLYLSCNNGRPYEYPVTMKYKGEWANGNFVFRKSSLCSTCICSECVTIPVTQYFGYVPNWWGTQGLSKQLVAAPGFPELWILNEKGQMAFNKKYSLYV
ncbi:hypothetical protein DFA_08668 [Cavenderia fasciculata]|uniref:Bulb-type lectin domain-containing protein n=1 Tax=Cavenderia fasciculata TaxID=261658 RepID=F4Q3L4_CACFS|nr:uncharacterized protein DFA_08668 [Cavenderia fasciculata]EGG17672.1 hypothetical protein DFA_08668 [Cavenderia fasciculata]|eukprot:XP_004356156.1 hypothetical protein DFA_08668 [Cavenderia fasciculata]